MINFVDYDYFTERSSVSETYWGFNPIFDRRFDLRGVLFRDSLTLGEVFLLEDLLEPVRVFFSVLDDCEYVFVGVFDGVFEVDFDSSTDSVSISEDSSVVSFSW